MKRHFRWMVQWHPPNGARVRRFAFTARATGRMTIALGSAGLLLAGGGLLIGRAQSRARAAIEDARSQNETLRTQQWLLREQAFHLAGQLFEVVERGRRVARLAAVPDVRASKLQPLDLSAIGGENDTGNEASLACFSADGRQLEALGSELATGGVEIAAAQTRTSAPAPARR